MSTLPPAPNEILTPAEVAAWLKVRPRQVRRLKIPVLPLGHRTPRYLAADIYEWLAELKQRKN